MQPLITFLQSREKNRWISIDNIEIYVRKGYINEINFLQIANVNVKLELRNQGIFTKFIDDIEKMKLMEGIFIENVVYPPLIKFFQNRNYLKYNNSTPPCFYLKWSE